jgi:hypothetical protein
MTYRVRRYADNLTSWGTIAVTESHMIQSGSTTSEGIPGLVPQHFMHQHNNRLCLLKQPLTLGLGFGSGHHLPP